MDRAGITGFLERAVDGEQDFSTGDFWRKIRRRRRLLFACVIVTMLPGLLLMLLTPPTWVATTEILIRYGASESAFLQNLIPDNRAALSGPVSSEILRSLPTLAETIRRYDIQEGDLYREPVKVLFGRVAEMLPFGDAPPPPGLPGQDPKITAMARTFQDSLEESSKSAVSAAKAHAVELLAKDQQVPQSLRGDELITVSVRSFNRLRVAEITNGLAATFIDRYYAISAEDAHRSYEFLSGLVAKGEADVRTLEQNPDAPSTDLASEGINGGSAESARGSPQVARLTNDLAALQSDLGRAQQFFRDDSPQVQRKLSEIASLKHVLDGQERLELAKSALQQLKARRFQALNTENLYRDRLAPISIVEPAVTPASSASAKILRPVGSAVTGGLIGLALGLALVTLLGLLDTRLFTRGDAERALRLPISGWLPRLPLRGRGRALPDADALARIDAGAGLLQVLAHLDAAGAARAGNVVAIASAADGDGKSLVALLLARALARAARTKVLLVDADPARATLTGYFGRTALSGLVDAAVATGPAAGLIVASGVPNLDLLPAGSQAERHNRGFYLGRLRALLDEVRGGYDLVIVDTPSSAAGSDVLMCCMAVDSVLVVVKAGVSCAAEVKTLLRALQEVAVMPKGVILNGAG